MTVIDQIFPQVQLKKLNLPTIIAKNNRNIILFLSKLLLHHYYTFLCFSKCKKHTKLEKIQPKNTQQQPSKQIYTQRKDKLTKAYKTM